MDFHALSRKQLQALCKKNKIPANMTNVAMADSLAALEQVEGIEEFLNPVNTDAQKFPDEKGAGTSACRTSIRIKPAVEEPESSKVSTRLRRGTRGKTDKEIDQENKDLNVPVTPAAATTRRRVPAASTRRKKEDEKPADHVSKTPAASNSRVKATSAYNTRRSVRLLDKSLSKMNLMDNEETVSVNVDAISEELSSVSQMEDSEDTENGASSLAISTEVIEKTDESELTSSAKNLSKVSFVDADETESVKIDEISEEVTDLPQKVEESEDAVEEKKIEFECQSNHSNSEMPLVSEEASDKGANLQAEPQESPIEIEKSGSPLEDMNNGSESDIELTKSNATEVNDAISKSEKKIEFECQSNHSNSEMPLVSEEASDTGANLQAEPQDSPVEIDKSGSPLDDMNNGSESDIELTKSNATEVNDAISKSDMVNDIQNSALMLSSHAEDEALVEMDGDLAEIHASKVDDEVDASMMVVENKNEAIDIENKVIESAYDYQNSEEMFSAENKAVENACNIQNSEEKFFDEKEVVEAEELGINTSSDIEESMEHVEKFFDEKEVVEAEELGINTSSDIEESKEHVEKDAVMEVSNEPSSSEGNTDVQILADSLSSEGNMNAQGVENSQSPFVTNEDKAESETTDVQSSLVRNEAEAESETTNVQSVADSQSPLGTNEAKAESETADVQSSLVRKEAEAESEITDVQIGNEESKETADVPTLTTDVPIQFAYQDQPAPKNNAAVEVKSVTITKLCEEEGDKQKENQVNDHLNSKSMRQLKKMLKNLSLDNQTNNDKNSNSVAKEVERKRTALQELPENRMAANRGQPLLP
ncbi:hypothetical protein QN277_009126 [Acacia crassicarpa]|uniref:Uncharacterized protein n=1 Tax=Acacia crassicarpa TaxID=499986 RepID=A0AAE1IST5_9FABA|nr:hypothetical protein QN277_009126 [Acacia crassicarpa]